MNEDQFKKLLDIISQQNQEIALSKALAACGINYYRFVEDDKKKLEEHGIEVISLGKSTYLRKKQ